jgi:hypothetical protein
MKGYEGDMAKLGAMLVYTCAASCVVLAAHEETLSSERLVAIGDLHGDYEQALRVLHMR